MYIKNIAYPAPDSHEEYRGLERTGNYLFPNFFKYIAWFIIFASVISSSTISIFYGMNFGHLKALLWVATALGIFVFHTIVALPLCLLFISTIKSFFLKNKPTIGQRKIDPCILLNPENPLKKERIMRLRECNAKLYRPTPFHKIHSQYENIKYNLQLRNTVAAIFFYSVSLITGFYAVMIHTSNMTYFSNKLIVEDILDSSYTNSIKFSEITTTEEFIRYLKETLLPTLLISPLNSTLDIRVREYLKIRDPYMPFPINLRKRQAHYADWDDVFDPYAAYEGQDFMYYSDDEFPPMFDEYQDVYDLYDVDARDKLYGLDEVERKKLELFNRGQTMNPNLKLMGKLRLRQIRVKPAPCLALKISVDDPECSKEMNILNVERKNFSLNWKPYVDEGLTKAQASPWIYQSARESGSMHIVAQFASYPGGGYILEIPGNFLDAMKVADSLYKFNWVDTRTRVIFVEFTLYCVNTNLFSVVTLVVEKLAGGYFMLSHKVKTLKLTYLPSEFERVTITLLILFFILSFLHLLRESLKIQRASLKRYITSAFTLVNASMVVLGLLSFAFKCVSIHYLFVLLKELEKSKDEFFSFTYPAYWSEATVHCESALVFLTFVKLVRLLGFRAVFHKFHQLLHYCLPKVTNLLCKQLLLFVAFNLFFRLSLANFSDMFNDFGLSMAMILVYTFSPGIFLDFNILQGPSFLCPVIFSAFITSSSIMFINIFIAVLCAYFNNIRNVHLTNTYDISDFIRHLLSSRARGEIFRMTAGGGFGKKQESLVLRLKGGGNRCPKEKKPPKKKCVYVKAVPEVQKVHLSEFVTKKMYDETLYRHFDADREAALRNIMAYHVTAEEEERKVLLQKALSALFLSFITTETDGIRLKKGPGYYFFVPRKSTIEAFDRRIFDSMKKVAENVGKEKGLVATEEEIEEELDEYQNYLGVLEEKLTLLERKLYSRA